MFSRRVASAGERVGTSKTSSSGQENSLEEGWLRIEKAFDEGGEIRTAGGPTAGGGERE